MSFLVNYFITEILYKYKHQLWPVDFFSSTFFGFYVSNVDDGMDLLVLGLAPKIFCCACEPNVRDLSSSYIQGLMRLVLIQKIIPPARLEKFSHKAPCTCNAPGAYAVDQREHLLERDPPVRDGAGSSHRGPVGRSAPPIFFSLRSRASPSWYRERGKNGHGKRREGTWIAGICIL